MAVTIEQIPSDKMDSNTYLVEEGGHVVIIDACAGQSVLDRIRSKGWTADYLLLTHEHFDHIWYLTKLREELAVPVVACRLTSDRIQDVKANLSNVADLLYYFKTGIIRDGKSESFTCAAADILFDDGLDLHWREHCLRLRRLPGHSPGSTVIALDPGSAEGAPDDSTEDPGLWDDCMGVFSGDYLILGEEEITRLKDGSPEDYEAIARPALDKIPPGMPMYPGHGPVYEKETPVCR